MSDFGGKMRLARERRGVSLRQIAATTKISMAALEALERNDVSKLPGGIFSRSFVRSYATEVGLDPDETVREFLDRFQGAPAASLPTPATVSEDEAVFENQQRIAALVVKLVLITVPLIVLILYFTMRTRPLGTASAVTAPSGVPAGRPRQGRRRADLIDPSANTCPGRNRRSQSAANRGQRLEPRDPPNGRLLGQADR